MTKPQYLIAVPPGLASVAISELTTHLSGNAEEVQILPARNSDLLSIFYEGSVNDLLGLRIAEDVFRVVAQTSLTGVATDLGAIGRMANGLKLPGRKQRIRVVVQASDEPWRSYRRIDMQHALEAAIMRQPGLKLVAEEADHEIWLFQVKKSLLAGVRLSDAGMKHRDYQKQHIEGGLRPAIAAALVHLSDPEPDDIFLDPMCGSGTILLERAHTGRYKLLLGGDINSSAVEATLENFGRKHKPWEIKRWDAAHLPLQDNSVNVIVTNPPWGRKVGSAHSTPLLYEKLFNEFVRALKPAGRLVILTDQTEIIKRLQLDYAQTLKLGNHYKNIVVLGHSANIFSWTIAKI